MDDLEVSQAGYARHIGKTRQYVNKLVRENKISKTESGKINIAEADHALKRVADPARHKDDNPVPAETSLGVEADQNDQDKPRIGELFSEKKTKTEHYRAEMARLNFEEKSGLLVRKTVVTEWINIHIGRIFSKLDSLPKRLKSELASMSDPREIDTLMKTEIRSMREAIAADIRKYSET